MKVHLFLICLTISAATSAGTFHSTDPECHMTAPQIIRYYGYQAEVHSVTTPDGYILQLHRIVPKTKPRGVVFLQHGLLDSSATWVMNTVNNSLGFLLSDYGFDVWMGNVRGNTYSRNHVTLKPSQKEFWDFSFDEMARYDLPTMIMYVVQHTGSKISYVGHSQGSEIAFIEFSRNHTLSQHMEKYVALAPVARISYVEGLFRALSIAVPVLEIVMDKLGIYEFTPHILNPVIAEFSQVLCPRETKLCSEIFYLLAGPTPNMNVSRIPVYGSHCPAGTSLKNMIHWDQLLKSKQLQMWDYGSEKENMKHYNSTKPPIYDVSKLDIPTLFIAGGNDYLGDPRDVEWLEAQLDHKILTEIIFYDDYNHLDVLWALNAKERVFMPTIKHLLSNII